MKVVYDETPEEMVKGVVPLLEAGANIVGGCCGSTPDHIRAFRTRGRRYLREGNRTESMSLSRPRPYTVRRERRRPRQAAGPRPSDKSGIGVHYVDAYIKPMNAKLADGIAVKCKRRGLKIVLTVGTGKTAKGCCGGSRTARIRS